MDFITILSIVVVACFVGYYVVWLVLHKPLRAVFNVLFPVSFLGALMATTPASAQGPEVDAALEFNHFMVAISVADIEAETRWFVDKLNFTVAKDASLRDGAVHFRWLTNGNQRIELIQTASQPGTERPTPPGHAAIRGIAQVTLETPDIEATKAALASRGVTPVLDITEVASLGIKVMYLQDPEGNAIEIAQKMGA